MSKPDWLPTHEYPFESRYFDSKAGRIHYVDEGTGPPIVMVHGNPTWSFVYRNLIKGLSGSHRCIAMDHLGFGFSDKPKDADYRPQAHAANLEALIQHLRLKDITLIVQDWGGPIGLSYAVQHPSNVRRLVILNTWMWAVNGDPHYERFSKIMGGPVGRLLIRRFNVFARVVMKKAYGNPALLTPQLHRVYQRALGKGSDRKACWVFPREILQSGPWLNRLWEQRDKISRTPTLIVWGMRDIAFRNQELERWETVFRDAKIIRLPEVGHYVQEESPDRIVAELRHGAAATPRAVHVTRRPSRA